VGPPFPVLVPALPPFPLSPMNACVGVGVLRVCACHQCARLCVSVSVSVCRRCAGCCACPGAGCVPGVVAVVDLSPINSMLTCPQLFPERGPINLSFSIVCAYAVLCVCLCVVSYCLMTHWLRVSLYLRAFWLV